MDFCHNWMGYNFTVTSIRRLTKGTVMRDVKRAMFTINYMTGGTFDIDRLGGKKNAGKRRALIALLVGLVIPESHSGSDCLLRAMNQVHSCVLMSQWNRKQYYLSMYNGREYYEWLSKQREQKASKSKK